MFHLAEDDNIEQGRSFSGKRDLDLLISSRLRWRLESSPSKQFVVKYRQVFDSSIMKLSREKLRYLRESSNLDRLSTPMDQFTSNAPQKKQPLPKPMSQKVDMPDTSEKTKVEYLTLEEMWKRCSGYSLENKCNKNRESDKPSANRHRPRLPRPSILYTPGPELPLQCPAVKPENQTSLNLNDFLVTPKRPSQEIKSAFFSPDYLNDIRPLPREMEIEPSSLEGKSLGTIYAESFISEHKIFTPPMELVDPSQLVSEEQFVSRSLSPGTILRRRFIIRKVVYEKRYGNTYLVEDLAYTGIHFIIKEVIPETMTPSTFQERWDAFQDTVRILSRFSHKGLVRVYDCFLENNRAYYIMENYQGLDLKTLSEMNVTGFSRKEAIRWGVQICNATDFLHYRPIPFTLGEMEPRHVMVGQDSKVRIVGFDLQRYFNLERTLAFRPDSPKKLYCDITKIARILYFLLTKQRFEKTRWEDRWPQPVSRDLRKLLDIACRHDQKTYGDVRIFREKLKNCQTMTKPKPVLLKPVFPAFLPSKGKRKLTNLINIFRHRPFVLLLETLILLFVIALVVFGGHTPPPYVHPAGSHLVYVAGGGNLFTIDPDSLAILDQRKIGFEPGGMIVSTVTFPDGNGGFANQPGLIATDSAQKSLRIFRLSDNLESLNRMQGSSPRLVIKDPVRDRLLVTYQNDPTITSLVGPNLDLGSLMKVIYEPGRLFYLNDPVPPEKKESRQPENRLEGFIALCPGGPSVISINPHTRGVTGIINLDFEPGAALLLRSRQTLMILDRSGHRMIPLDLYHARAGKAVDFPRTLGRATHLAPSPREDAVWVSFDDPGQVVSFSLKTGALLRRAYSGGLEPMKLAYRKQGKQLWVLNEKSKGVSVLDADTGKLKGTIPLGVPPSLISFE